jgi:hypothetical protein
MTVPRCQVWTERGLELHPISVSAEVVWPDLLIAGWKRIVQTQKPHRSPLDAANGKASGFVRVVLLFRCVWHREKN